jgi:hypothetical protein
MRDGSVAIRSVDLRHFGLMLVTRVVIELGDVIVGLVIHGGTTDANTFFLIFLAAVEVFFVVKLVSCLSKTS